MFYHIAVTRRTRTSTKVLTRCKYPRWAFNRIKNKISAPNHPKGNSNSNKKPTSSSTITNSINKRNYVVVPYTKGLSESLTTVCKKIGIQVYFKGGKTIKDLQVALKDKEHITKKSGIIYRFKCDRVECNEEYIGESSRTFGERFKEQQNAPSPIYDHFNNTCHTTTLENFSIVGREDKNLVRLIKNQYT